MFWGHRTKWSWWHRGQQLEGSQGVAESQVHSLAPPLTSFVTWGDVGWLSSPQNSLFVALTTSGSVFGDNAFRKVVRVKWGRRVGLWSSVTGVLIRRGRDTNSACLHTKAFWGHSEQEAISKPRTEASGETNHAGYLGLDFQPLELWEISHSVWILWGSPSRLIQGSYKISPGFKSPICISDGVRNLFCYRVVGWEMTECNQHSASVDAISYMKQLVATRTGEHSFSNSPGFLQSTQHNNKTTPITTHGSFGFRSTFCWADVLLKTQTYSTGAVFLVPSTGYLSFKSLLNSLYILVLFCLLYLKDSKHKSGKFQTNAQLTQHMELHLLVQVLLCISITYIRTVLVVTWVCLALFGRGTEWRYIQSITSYTSNFY